ncbi:acetyl-CoA acetyltransferase [Spongiibacter taiwanensis]|uniref:acetyl-CoA acetyltransferase n=1 Tax=Spongiibacter taiwanensis TaxID=1748242 RepID=UPI0020363DE6|nr:acetyl-CoA acetyltransferase [Spongiibacter taiwanensis]USA44043.1 acetyl-CoA acetyltransferase [Spongiibacter taiwanensis]
MMNPETTPVIVAVGEITDKPADISQALEPVALMAKALEAANADAGGGLLKQIDSIDLVGLITWRYTNPVGLLCEKLGIAPARQHNASMGGETPIRLIHDAALAIARGEQRVAAFVGGEAMNAMAKARKQGVKLDWTPLASKEEAVRFANDRIAISPVSKLIGVRDPSQMYPLYEMAAQKAWQESPAEGAQHSAQLWQKFAAVAANNPFAWLTGAPSADEIGTVSPSNRIISWPYPKLMVANPSVNQGAAIIVSSLAAARAAGVPEENLIYIHGGAAASEPDDYLLRDRYDRSAAQTAVLEKSLEFVGGDAKGFAKMELYSCFPIVPKLALRCLGIDINSSEPTVTGGLTFFGGPLNNYMSHATCAMVRALRAAPGETGLLYGQGGFVSKHHSLIVSSKAPREPLAEGYSVQSVADAAYGEVPPLQDDYTGEAAIETYTIQYDRDGQPLQGVVVALGKQGQRCLCRVDPGDTASLALLLDESQSAVGRPGQVSIDADGRPNWSTL